jgi:hypothetical protein
MKELQYTNSIVRITRFIVARFADLRLATIQKSGIREQSDIGRKNCVRRCEHLLTSGRMTHKDENGKGGQADA